MLWITQSKEEFLSAYLYQLKTQVLKDGSDREADRVAEILDRTLSIVQEAIAALGIV